MAAFQRGTIHLKQKTSVDNADAGWVRVYVGNNGEIFHKDENGNTEQLANVSEVASVSGSLDTRITTIENDYVISSDLNDYTLLTTTSALTGSLQSQITSNDSDISSISGSLSNYVLKAGDTMTGNLTINYGAADSSMDIVATGTSVGDEGVLHISLDGDNAGFQVDRTTVSGTGGRPVFRLKSGGATDKAFQTSVTGSNTGRFNLQIDGKMEWGGGGTRDTNLYRSAANTLTTDDSFVVGDTLTVNGDLIPLGSQTSNTNVIIGLNAGTVDGNEIDCVVIGNGAYSDNSYGTVVGRGSYSDGGEDSVVVGDYSFANGDNNISLGSSMRVGDDATANRSIGIGADSIIGNHDDNIGIGYDFYIYGDRSIAIGGRNRNGFTQALASDQIMLGYGASNTGANRLQIGGNRATLNVTLTVPGQFFTDGEVITASNGATGKAVDNAFNNVLDVAMSSATTFTSGASITGADSGHTATITAVTLYESEINTVNFNRGVEQITFVNPIQFSDSIVVQGDLVVNGTTTTVNTTELLVEDNIMTLNSGVTGSPTLNSGIEVERGTSTNAQLIWDETLDTWTFGLSGSLTPIASTTFVSGNYVSKTGDTMTGELILSDLQITDTNGLCETIWYEGGSNKFYEYVNSGVFIVETAGLEAYRIDQAGNIQITDGNLTMSTGDLTVAGITDLNDSATITKTINQGVPTSTTISNISGDFGLVIENLTNAVNNIHSGIKLAAFNGQAAIVNTYDGTQISSVIIGTNNGSSDIAERIRINASGLTVAALAGNTDEIVTLDANGKLVASGVTIASLGVSGGSSLLDDLLDVVITTPTSGEVLAYNGSNWVNKPEYRPINLQLRGFGDIVPTGFQGYLPIISKCEIDSWVFVGDISGSCSVDLWKSTTIPTSADSIVNTNYIEYSNVVTNGGTTGWTTTILNEGDIIAFNVRSATNVTEATLTLKTRIL